MADDDIRRLVQSSAAQPSGEAPMGSILDRARRRRLRRRVATALVPLLVVVAGAAAVATALPGQRVELGPADPGATSEPTPTSEPTLTPEPTPEPTAEPSPEPTPEPTPTREEDEPAGDAAGVDEVTVYFAREHASGYWVEPEVVQLDEPTVAVARAAMEALVTARPREPGRITLAADGSRVRDVNLDGDVLVVDFSGLVGPQGLGSSQEMALVQQIAHTGAQFDSVRAVRILVDGQQVESLAGHVDISEPGEPSPFALSPITFTTHTSGDTVRAGDVTVGGEACTFEATVLLTLLAPDGSVAEETFTTATSGCPERGTWEHTFTLDEPGAWTIMAAEDDPSDGEGRPPFDVGLELHVD